MKSPPADPPRPANRWQVVDGIVLLDKPVGLSSNAALQRVRRIFQAEKAGHTGSLDPLASGLLPVCLGQATKICGILLDADKSYRVGATLGVRTTTADAEGEVIERQSVPELDVAHVQAVLDGFLGEGEQVPPMYSALKHQGRRLYELARQGIDVERPPRKIVLHRLALLAMAGQRLEFEVDCGKGTYVRSLVEDLAAALGTVGHVDALRRLSLGPFDGRTMWTLEQLEARADSVEGLQGLMLPLDAALTALPSITLSEPQQRSLLHGQAVPETGPGGRQVRIYGPNELFLGVGRFDEQGRLLAPERIMVDPSRAARTP